MPATRKIKFKKTERPDIRRSVFLLLFFLAAAAALFLFSSKTGISLCMSYTVFGIPCPSCGITRAWLFVFQKQFREAFAFHPLWWFALVIPVLFILDPRTGVSIKAFKKADPMTGQTPSYKKWDALYISMIALMVIIWIIRMALRFPVEPPVNFNSRALLPRLLGFLFY